MLNGEELQLVTTVRYLGVALDCRLSLEAHWLAEGRRLKALGASLRRLVRGDSTAFKLLLRSVVEGRIRHAISAAPPSTLKAWHCLESALTYLARLLVQDFARMPGCPYAFASSSSEVMARAGLIPPRRLASHAGLQLIYGGIFEGRALGHLLQCEVRPAARTTRASSKELLSLRLPPVSTASLRRLAPFALLETWNGLRLSLLTPGPSPLSSLAAFKTFLTSLPQ
jgi:hypothetical protein